MELPITVDLGISWRMLRAVLLSCVAVGVVAGCSLSTTTEQEPVVVFVTATPSAGELQQPPLVAPVQQTAAPTVILSPVPASVGPIPTADPPRFSVDAPTVETHTVQPGDTLFGIAARYGTTLESLLAVNALANPNVLEVGQVIQLPGVPDRTTPSLKIIPDVRVVRGPGSADFDVIGFVNQQPGYIRQVTDEVDTNQADGSTLTETLTAGEIVARVSLEYSVDARLLLTLLEYHAGWLSQSTVTDALKERPFDVERDGFYRQLAWMANQLNAAYYGWKYRGLTVLEFSGTDRYLYDPGLNAGTVAVQYALAQVLEPSDWLVAVQSTGGFFSRYFAYFGDPFAEAVDPVVPANLVQPEMALPFGSGEVWYFTGGAHGGWASGSAWSAVDFAPPDEREDGVFCFTSATWVRAVAPGMIARSDDGAVVLDLDGDGDETTGWTVFYLHLAAEDRLPVGTQVATGDAIGRASCEGGFSTATHLHIARRYNGEWIPADCFVCTGNDIRSAFNLGGWDVVGIPNQEYQGFLERGAEQRRAEQGRTAVVNQVSW